MPNRPINGLWNSLRTALENRVAGQGVVEYAGAMVIASLIIVTIMPLATTGMNTVYTRIFTGIQNYFSAEVSALQ